MNHWDKVYSTKNENEVSWFQEIPYKSLELIDEFRLEPNDAIIDIGGGDSHLVDELLARGFVDVTVLDISEAALNKVKQRLPGKTSVTCITSDIIEFKPLRKFKLWHDRATFHFLISSEEIENYLRIASSSIEEGGYLIVSTFSKDGPIQCSGLPITQYSDVDLRNLFGKYFKNLKCFEDTHTTPWGSKQNFVYCGFKKV